MRAITDCGDLAVLLPLAIALALLLWRCESRAAAGAWIKAFVFCLAVTFALKLGFLTCSRAWGISIVSPSGHASMSTAVYGALTIVVATHSARWRLWAMFAGTVMVGAIAFTRIMLHVHTKSEVAIGLTVGLVSLFLFVWSYVRLTHPRINVPTVTLSTLCVFMMLYGVRLPAETYLYKLAHSVRSQSRVCHPLQAGQSIRLVVGSVAQ